MEQQHDNTMFDGSGILELICQEDPVYIEQTLSNLFDGYIIELSGLQARYSLVYNYRQLCRLLDQLAAFRKGCDIVRLDKERVRCEVPGALYTRGQTMLSDFIEIVDCDKAISNLKAMYRYAVKNELFYDENEAQVVQRHYRYLVTFLARLSFAIGCNTTSLN
jgi:hypothetical protein